MTKHATLGLILLLPLAGMASSSSCVTPVTTMMSTCGKSPLAEQCALATTQSAFNCLNKSSANSDQALPPSQKAYQQHQQAAQQPVAAVAPSKHAYTNTAPINQTKTTNKKHKNWFF